MSFLQKAAVPRNNLYASNITLNPNIWLSLFIGQHFKAAKICICNKFNTFHSKMCREKKTLTTCNQHLLRYLFTETKLIYNMIINNIVTKLVCKKEKKLKKLLQLRDDIEKFTGRCHFMWHGMPSSSSSESKDCWHTNANGHMQHKFKNKQAKNLN